MGIKIHFKEMQTETVNSVAAWGWGWEWEMTRNGQEESLGDDGNVLVFDYGDGCTTL